MEGAAGAAWRRPACREIWKVRRGMAVHLTIENETSLPDGGPLTYSIAGKRGIDIGRDAYLDWCLPDPARTVSGKHCEIRYRDGGYWLHDVSRNGTFLNRSSSRLGQPHRLRDGDRIEVGRYIIAVRVEGDEAAPDPAGSSVPAPSSPAEYWNSAADAAPPMSPKDLRPPRESRPVQADFREWAIDVPPPTLSGPGSYDPFSAPPPPARLPSFEEMAWAQGPAAPPPAPEPYIPVPTPRRPLAPGGGSPWDAVEVQPSPAGPSAGWPESGVSPSRELDAWAAQPSAPAPSAPAGWDLPPAPRMTEPAPDPAVAWSLPPPAPPPAPAGERTPVGATPPAAEAENPWGRPSLGSERPRPAPAAEPASPTPGHPPPPAPPPATASGGDIVARFAKGAGMSPEVLGWRDPGDFAEELGTLMRLTAENVKQLLSARAETKRVARAGGHTMIQALDNNPLKFSPTVDDALKIMLGRPSGGYLDARKALEQSFKDLKVHQVKSYSAMQHALRLLMEDLDPAAIEESTGSDRGLGALLGSKKAKFWDLYVARWDTLTSPHEDGMVDAFMMFFAECYDRGGDKG